jgi:hypothetical protein
VAPSQPPTGDGARTTTTDRGEQTRDKGPKKQRDEKRRAQRRLVMNRTWRPRRRSCGQSSSTWNHLAQRRRKRGKWQTPAEEEEKMAGTIHNGDQQ